VKLIVGFSTGRSTVESIADENGLLKQLTKAILERALAAGISNNGAIPVAPTPGRRLRGISCPT